MESMYGLFYNGSADQVIFMDWYFLSSLIYFSKSVDGGEVQS